MKFMTHPEHGATNANDGDIEQLEKDGWKVTDYNDWMVVLGKRPQMIPKVEEPVKRKPGRPARTE